MPTIRLTPSTYYLSNSSYLSVSNASNMYDNTDSTSYATVTNSRTSTSSYYIYLRGFNFDSVPSGAIIDSFSVMLKAYESGASTSTSYVPYLCNGTTALSGHTSAITTSTQVLTFSSISESFDTLAGYGSDFGIRINCRRASRNTTSYVYIYGAEIEVNYTMPTPATVTSTLTGNGTIDPDGEVATYEGSEYTLTITPTDKTATVTAKKNGASIELTAHGQGATVNRVLGSFTLISGGFNSGESYFEGLEGNGVDSSQTTTNYYSSSSSTQAIFTYDMSFDLPSNAVIERIWCEVNGHAESTSQSSEYMCVQLKSGNTDLSEQINFKDVSTSNTTITLEAEATVSQLASMVLECTLGYYGGALNGATCYVQYSIPSGEVEYYTYTYIVDGDAVIAVTIGGSVETSKLYTKDGTTWKEVATAYKKVNGAWVQQDVTSLFDASKKYRRG